MPTANTVAVRVALDNAQETIKALRGLGDAGEEAFQRLAGSANRTAPALAQLQIATNDNQKGFRRFGEVARQAGFQIGDFAVQVQSGTSVVVAAGQQLGQLAGAFGVYGAAVGAAISVGAALITYFTRQNEVTEEAADYIDKFGQAMEAQSSRIKNYSDLLGEATGQTKTLLESIAEAQKQSAEKRGGVLIGQLSEEVEAGRLAQLQAGVGAGPASFAGLPALQEKMRGARVEAKALGEEVDTLSRKALETRDVSAFEKVINQLGLVQTSSDEARERIIDLITQLRNVFGEVGGIQKVQDLANQTAASLAAAARGTPPGERTTREFVQPQSATFRDAEKQSIEDLGDFERDQIAQTVAAREAAAARQKTAGQAAANATAARLAREIEQQDQAIAAIDEKLAASEREAEAIGKGAYALKLVNIEHDKQLALLKAEKDFKHDLKLLDEARLKIEQTAANERKEAAIATPVPTGNTGNLIGNVRQTDRDNAEEVAKVQLQVQDDIQEKRKKALEEEGKIQQQIYENLAKDISSTLADGLKQALTNAEGFDFGALSASLGDSFATALTTSLTAPLTELLTESAKGFGDAIAAGLSQLFAPGAAPGAAPGGGVGPAGVPGMSGAPIAGGAPAGGAGFGADWTAGGSAMGGAAFGYTAGSVYSQAAGLKPGNQAAMGGAIGGAAGAAIGTMIAPGIGTIIGGAIGTAAGAAIGGMIGGENNLGNDRSTQAFRAGRGITYGDVSFSPENRGITEGILDQIITLEKGFKELGGSVGDFKLLVQAGNKTGITVNGKKYANAQEALVASIEILIGETTGLTATQQTILANTKGTSAQEIGQDLQFGQQYDDIIFQGTEFDRQLRDLAEAFGATSRRAAELGLNTDVLTVAYEKQAEQIRFAADQAVRGLSEQLASASGDTSLGTQLHMLETQMRDLAAQAFALGVPIERVAEVHAAAAQRIIFANDQMVRGFNEQLASAAGDNSLGLQLHVLETQMRNLAVQAAALGIPIERVAEVHAAAAQRIVAANQQLIAGLNRQVAGIFQGDVLGERLGALNDQVQGLAGQLVAAGQSLDELAAQHQRAAKQIVADYKAEQAAAAEQRRAAIRGFYSQLVALGGNNSLQARLEALNTQFQQLKQQARELGQPLKDVTNTMKAAEYQLRFQHEQEVRGFYSQLAALGGDKSLRTQQHDLETQFKELYRAANQLGIPVAAVTKVYVKASQDLRQAYDENLKALERQDVDLSRQIRESSRNIPEFFQSLIDPLRQAAANDNSLSPLAQIQTARREVAATGERARGGDVEAIRELAGDIQRLEQLRQQYLGSGGLGAEIQREITAVSQGVVNTLEQQQREAMASVPDVLRETTADVVRTLIDNFNRLVEEQQKLRREIELQRKAA